MSKKLGLAVASALLAAASSANAGIVIPAGDWTLDINGNVNAYYMYTKASGDSNAALAAPTGGGIAMTEDVAREDKTHAINTGLLPSWLGFTGKTRQNDLDVEFTISLQPGASDNGITGDGATGGSQNTQFLNRQTYVSFGDKSWGSIKLGKDLGIFASDAILNDITLLGVGGGSGNSGTAVNTTLGGIGTGYIYAAWKGQIAYTSPNWNGFQFTVGVTNPNQGFGDLYQDRLGFEGKASYSWAGDFAGKVWASAASYDVTTLAAGATNSDDYRANAWDIGATVNVAGFGLTGYYYDGKGVGTTLYGNLGAQVTNVAGNTVTKRRDSDGGYVQATYTIPGAGTKIGAAYGVSNLDDEAGDAATLVEKNSRITIGAYHPLTKHLNLVAEFNRIKSEAQGNGIENKSRNLSLGAIMFF